MTGYQILSWNVNGLRAIAKKGFRQWLLESSPDILCVQETKSSPEQLNENLLNIPGYHVYFASAEKKGYSGVAIYTKEKPKTVTGLGIRPFDIEGRTIKAEFNHFTLFNIYYPNGKASKERLQYKMDFYEAFLKVALDLQKAGTPLIICGDVNTAHKPVDLARPRENETISGFLPEERAWIDRFLSNGFYDTFRLFNQEGGHYTWWDYKTRARERNIGWRIDYFFINKVLKPQLNSAFMLSDVPGSDHCPIGIELKLH